MGLTPKATASPIRRADAGAPVSRPMTGAGRRQRALAPAGYFITGIENSAPSLTPDGQRDVTVFVRV